MNARSTNISTRDGNGPFLCPVIVSRQTWLENNVSLSRSIQIFSDNAVNNQQSCFIGNCTTHCIYTGAAVLHIGLLTSLPIHTFVRRVSRLDNHSGLFRFQLSALYDYALLAHFFQHSDLFHDHGTGLRYSHIYDTNGVLGRENDHSNDWRSSKKRPGRLGEHRRSSLHDRACVLPCLLDPTPLCQ